MDWKATLFGAAIGFVASVGTIIVQRWMDKAGKLKMYCVTVCAESALDSIGFVKSQQDFGKITFILPIKLEIQNTSNTARVIRDVSMWMYKNGAPVAEMTQIQHTTHTSGVSKEKTVNEYGGDKNMYSFVIQPRSIQREHCSFFIKAAPDEFEKYDFDEVRLSYFDEQDRKQVFPVKKIDNAWVPRRMKGDDEWIALKK